MRNILCLFTYPESLQPFRNYIPGIAFAGKKLYEHAIKTSLDLKSEEIILFDKGQDSGIIFKDPDLKNINIHKIKSINDLEQHLTSNLVIFFGETVFSAKAVDFVNEKIDQNPNIIQIFGMEKTSGKFQDQTAYLDSNNENLISIQVEKNLHQVKKLPQIVAFYFPRPALSPLVPSLIEKLLFTTKENNNLALENNTEFYGLAPDSFVNLQFPWQIINANELLLSDIDHKVNGIIEEGVKINGNVVIESNVQILQGTYINGPVYISKGSVIGPNCFLRGKTFIGENVKIGQSVEVKNSVIMDNTNIGHLSYIGDSVIGPENNFGAGSKTANLAFHDKSIKMNVSGIKIDSNRRKLGIITGKKVRTGINSSLMPGIKLYNHSIVGAHVLIQNDLPEQTICAYDKKNELIRKKHNFF
jgi:bifunctional UDP-N-acetylglucosamine pyrophosphorylase/glucosamine-1-phosphate N-acetyltransferase